MLKHHYEFLHYEVQDLEILHLYSSIPEIFAGIFCRHYPQTKHTVVADTPEQRRIAENTKIQSNVSKDGSIGYCHADKMGLGLHM